MRTLALLSLSMLFLAQHHGTAGRNVDLQPFLAVFGIQGIRNGSMDNAVIRQSVAAVRRCICVQHDFVFSFWYQETVVREGTGGGEVEDEEKVATHVGQHLVTVVMHNLPHRLLLEVLHGLHAGEHSLVEIPQIMVAKGLVVHQMPLATGIFVTPTITLTGEVNPLRMAELIAHKVQVATIDAGSSYQADHLVEGNVAVYHAVAVLFHCYFLGADSRRYRRCYHLGSLIMLIGKILPILLLSSVSSIDKFTLFHSTSPLSLGGGLF